MTIRSFALFAGIATLVASGAGAVPPSKKSLAQSAMSNAARVYAYLALQHRPSSGVRPGRPVAGWGSLHVDLAARKVAIDGESFRWRYVGGQTTFHNATLGRAAPAMQVPSADPMFSVLVTELDSGFAGSTWTRADPPNVAPGLAPESGHEWWRVNLPATWDDPYRIWFDLTGVAGCEVAEAVVTYADTGRIVQVKNPIAGDGWLDLRFPLCDAIHWNPVFSQSQYGAPATPFQSTLFPNRPMHRDEYRPATTRTVQEL
ncbi:MAG: hypothetical protein ABMB14_25915 [Myxococcota bacterium]